MTALCATSRVISSRVRARSLLQRRVLRADATAVAAPQRWTHLLLLLPGSAAARSPSPALPLRNPTARCVSGARVSRLLHAAPVVLAGVNLIAGYTEGVLLMVEGERAKLHVPSAKGYGSLPQGSPGGGWYIPENSNLCFGTSCANGYAQRARSVRRACAPATLLLCLLLLYLQLTRCFAPYVPVPPLPSYRHRDPRNVLNALSLPMKWRSRRRDHHGPHHHVHHRRRKANL